MPVSSVMLACSTPARRRGSPSSKEIKGEKVKVRQCKRADCREEIDQDERQRIHAAAQAVLPRLACGQLKDELGLSTVSRSPA